MDNDLEDIGLEALERAESADIENPAENVDDEEDTSTNNVGESEEIDEESQTGGETTEGAEVSEDTDKSEDDNTEEEDVKSEEPAEDTEKKKEISDEEFEEMAKKRGYAKEKNEEEVTREQALENVMAKPEEISDEIWNAMPNINKVVYNQLPYIEAVGSDGETIRVKTPEQLPDDFEFKNKKSEAQFYNDLQAQENRADKLMNEITSRVNAERESNERVANARNIISQIEALQKSGALPTPKAKPNTKEFDNDPDVALINKVLNYHASRANQGVNLTIEDALTIYKAQHPNEFGGNTNKGDAERVNISKKIAGKAKSADTATNKGDNKPQYYRPGMSVEDILDRVLDDMD